MFELYGEDTHVVVRATETVVSPTTGAVTTQALGGRTDITVALFASPDDAAPLPALTLTLTEASGTPGTYYGTWQGAALRTALAAVPDGTHLWRAISVGSDGTYTERGVWWKNKPL